MVNFIDAFDFFIIIFQFVVKFCDCISGNVKFMRNFTVKILFLFEFFVIFFVFLCDSLNFTIFLRQNWQTIFFKNFDFLFEGSFDILPIRLINFSLSKYFLNFFFFFLDSLVSELFFFLNELNSLIILIDHRFVFHLPLCV